MSKVNSGNRGSSRSYSSRSTSRPTRKGTGRSGRAGRSQVLANRAKISSKQEELQKDTFGTFNPQAATSTAANLSEQINQGRNANFSRAAGAARTLSGALGTATSTQRAIDDIQTAVRTGDAQDINTAAGSTASAAGNAISTANAALQTANTANLYRQSYNAARGAGATGRIARAAANEATRQALAGSSRQVARGAAVRATTQAARGTMTRAASRNLGRTAGRAASRAAGRAAAGSLGRAVGRFAPGVNVAIAGLDAAQAVSIQRDPNASTSKKVAGWLTAGASGLAATNIPIVSQAGAVGATVGSFFRDWLN